jgi:hypothetical protein
MNSYPDHLMTYCYLDPVLCKQNGPEIGSVIRLVGHGIELVRKENLFRKKGRRIDASFIARPWNTEWIEVLYRGKYRKTPNGSQILFPVLNNPVIPE